MSRGTSESVSERAERAATMALIRRLTVSSKPSGQHRGFEHMEDEATGDSECERYGN